MARHRGINTAQELVGSLFSTVLQNHVCLFQLGAPWSFKITICSMTTPRSFSVSQMHRYQASLGSSVTFSLLFLIFLGVEMSDRRKQTSFCSWHAGLQSSKCRNIICTRWCISEPCETSLLEADASQVYQISNICALGTVRFYKWMPHLWHCSTLDQLQTSPSLVWD